MVVFSISRYLMLFCFICFSTRVMSDFPYQYCPNTTTYSPNSIYQANLNQLLLTLSSNATRERGFYNYTVGRDPSDAVYGLFLCRGDVNTDVCKQCVNTSVTEILKGCPNQKEAIMVYERCMLRYSYQSIFSTVDPSALYFSDYIGPNITEQPDRFKRLLGDTMGETVTLAANNLSGKKFATKSANFTSFQSLYTLAQCTPDISIGDCNMCLRAGISILPLCCDYKQGARVIYPSCNIRYEMYQFYNTTMASAPPPLGSVQPSPPLGSTTNEGNGGISRKVILAIVVPIVVSSVLFCIGFCFLIRRNRKKHYDGADKENGSEISAVESLQYDLNSIKLATNNFSADNKIGQGGFGDVYKGSLPNGQEIAVKRLSRLSGQGTKEFKNEATVVAKLQHRNLVRLIGFCLEGEEKILVYEFVSNKSLDYFLFDPQKQRLLDWPKRYNIIRGIARGMVYLHEDSRLRIIHRDLKASNILLDGEMNPKISDFGMARIFDVDQSEEKTSRIVGTFGYMAPEYAMHGQFSVKSDVFSFGVLVLEIISGRKNSSFNQPERDEHLVDYAWKLWSDETPLDLMDPTLKDSYSRNEVFQCIQIALLCVQEHVNARPTMATILITLNNDSVTLAVPHQPAFFLLSISGSIPGGKELDQSTSNSKTGKFTSNSPILSLNEASMTELYPR